MMAGWWRRLADVEGVQGESMLVCHDISMFLSNLVLRRQQTSRETREKILYLRTNKLDWIDFSNSNN